MLRSSEPTAQDAADFIAGMQRIGPAPAEQLQLVLEQLQVAELARGEHLLQAGDVATKSAFLLRGLLREYFVMPDGTERTKAFVQEAQPTGSLADLLSARPSRAFVVAHEPSRLLLASFSDLRNAGNHSLIWLAWYVRCIERMFVDKAEREYELLGLDAQARYTAFVQRYPGLETRVAARHIASYLGITAVHLSRLRRKRRSQK